MLSQVTIYEKLQDAEKTAREAALGNLGDIKFSGVSDTEFENIDKALTERLSIKSDKVAKNRAAMRLQSDRQAVTEAKAGSLGLNPTDAEISARSKEIYMGLISSLADSKVEPVLDTTAIQDSITGQGAVDGMSQSVNDALKYLEDLE